MNKHIYLSIVDRYEAGVKGASLLSCVWVWCY